MFRILTEVTVVIHLLFILFVVVGGFIARRSRLGTIMHLSAVAWAVFAEVASGVVCPLTVLENYSALRAGLSTYREDFITRYLVPVIYQEGVPTGIQYLLVALVVGITIIAYAPKRKRNA